MCQVTACLAEGGKAATDLPSVPTLDRECDVSGEAVMEGDCMHFIKV